MCQSTFPCAGGRRKRSKTRAVFSRASSKHTPAMSCPGLLSRGEGGERWSRGCKNTDLKVARGEGYRIKFCLVLITPSCPYFSLYLLKFLGSGIRVPVLKISLILLSPSFFVLLTWKNFNSISLSLFFFFTPILTSENFSG